MNDTNIVVDLLKALPQLIQEGISLIKEGEANRKNFFEVKVKPIQSSSQILFDAHLITLRKILESLQDGKEDVAIKLVESATLFEQAYTDELADSVYQAQTIEVRGELGDLFSFYLLCVGKILVTPPARDKRRESMVRIAVYSDLNDLRDLGLLNPERVKELIDYLFKWNRRMLSSYNELQKYCLSK